MNNTPSENKHNIIHKVISSKGDVAGMNEIHISTNSRTGTICSRLEFTHDPYMEKGYKKCVHCGRYIEYAIFGNKEGLKYNCSDSCSACNINGEGGNLVLKQDELAGEILLNTFIELRSRKEKIHILKLVSDIIGVEVDF